MISRLSQTGGKCGVLALLAALTAFAVSGNSVSLLIFPILISIVQLFCLIEGPWTAPMLQRLPVRVAAKRRLPYQSFMQKPTAAHKHARLLRM